MSKEDPLRICVLPYAAKYPHRIQQQIRALEGAGHRIVAYRWNRGGAFESQDKSFDFETRTIHLPAPESGINLLFYLPAYYSRLYSEIRDDDYDVYHCTHLFTLIFLHLFNPNAKVVYESREMFPWLYAKYAPNFMHSYARSAIQYVENYCVSRADYIFTVDSVENKLEKRYKKYNENVSVIYNVQDINLDTDMELVEKLKNKYSQEVVFVYVGGIMIEKGSINMLRLVDNLNTNKNIRLLVLGRFKNGKERFGSYVDDHDIEDIVSTIGWVSFDKMVCYLRASDIALALHEPTDFYKEYPSKGTGAKFFNYMQVGLPIVAPSFGEIGDIVRENNCGITVDTTDISSAVSAVQDLISNPELRRQMGASGRDAVEQKYNWDIEKGKLLDAYKSITKE